MATTPDFSINLTGQVALVTGASSGLGERFARVLAACGASVAVVARRQDQLDRLVLEIEAEGGRAAAYPLDVRDTAAIPAVVERIAADFGPITILVNNAGITDGRRAVNMTAELVDAVLETNLRGPYLLACEVAKRLILAELPGRIVNIGSIGAFTCSKPGQSLYSVSKAGINRMTEVLAVEWAPNHINVNAIVPGTFHSEMTARMIAKIGDNSAAMPRKRFCGPEMLDSTLLFLVSPSSQAVTGTVIKVDDGQTGR